MAYVYREQLPSARCVPYIECYWTMRCEAAHSHRVLPDGCMDLLFSERAGARLVGSMTRFGDMPLDKGDRLIGIRFHPGMAGLFLSLPAAELVDATTEVGLPELNERLLEAPSLGEAAGYLEAWLHFRRPPERRDAIWRVLASRHGQANIPDLAREAGLSERQLRRVATDATGLSPKQLCRILRFRRAADLITRMRRGQWAQLAADCGYADQAHLIHEFRAFSGYTPAEYRASLGMSDFSNTAPAVSA